MVEGPLCGVVVRVLGYRSGGPGSILGDKGNPVVLAERFPMKN
jgi:hypothetical protein